MWDLVFDLWMTQVLVWQLGMVGCLELGKNGRGTAWKGRVFYPGHARLNLALEPGRGLGSQIL